MSSPSDPLRCRLLEAVSVAAIALGVTPIGKPAYGWRDRTCGRRVTGIEGDGWLRVLAATPDKAHGKIWEGNATAAAIHGIAKPTLLAAHEWNDNGVRLRGELLSFVPGEVCSPTPELRHPLALPQEWWSTLRHSLDTLAAWPTDRESVRQDLVPRRLHAAFGDQVDSTVHEWTTAHGDSTSPISPNPSAFSSTGRVGAGPRPGGMRRISTVTA